MTQDEFVKFLQEHAPKPGDKFQPLVYWHPDGKSLDILLKHEPYSGEWIKGERGDVCLYRSDLDGNVIGAHLECPEKPEFVSELERLQRYEDHDWHCDVFDDLECNCGFDDPEEEDESMPAV